MKRLATLLSLAAALAGEAVPPIRGQGVPDYEKPPIHYSTTAPADAIQRLQTRLASGTVSLAGSEREILRAVLRELQVPEESQVLVFSRTSLQRALIRPNRPRALYFSASVYVGWVPGGLIEIAAIDPQLGPVFYAFDPRASAANGRKFERDADCLRCHGGTFVRDIPGVFARSVVTSHAGEPLLRFGTELVDDETPFSHRWGGWYVTGYTGTEDHRGNAFGSEDGDANIFPTLPARPQELSDFFEPRDYLAATSDVVALLVLEHQMSVQNALTHASVHGRKMIAYQHSLQKAFGEPPTDEPVYDSVKSVFASEAEAVVDRLLFRNAAPLPAGVVGHAGFRTAFGRDAKRTKTGRALKDLQLSERLFALRCSYMIYSDTFAALPATLKRRIFDRLRAALEERNPTGRYAYMPLGERQQISAILLETHPEARSRWLAGD